MAKVADENTQTFSDGMKMLEAMAFVMQRVMNEVLVGEIVHSHANGSVDFQEYLREFWLCMLMADFAVWCRSLQPEVKLIEAPTNNDVVVFGGS